MVENKGEQIKIYVVIGLALVLVISLYVRFIHGRAVKDMDNIAISTAMSSLEVPQVKVQEYQSNKARELHSNEPLRRVGRDIFAPLRLPVEVKDKAVSNGQTKQSQSLRLKGTIVDEGPPIAIVNDRFVYIGDRIGGYRVTRIGKDNIILNSNGGEVILEVLKQRGKRDRALR